MNAHYDEEEVKARLPLYEGWSFEENAIRKTYEFRDFSGAFSFMMRVAMEAEKMDHHPDWQNVWNRVEIRLSTHSAGGVTDKDFELAERIDKRKKGE